MCVVLPAEHLRIVVDWDVGSEAAVVRPKVAVWCSEPFIETSFQRKVLWSVAQMPVVTNEERSLTVTSVGLKDHATCFYIIKFRPA